MCRELRVVLYQPPPSSFTPYIYELPELAWGAHKVVDKVFSVQQLLAESVVPKVPNFDLDEHHVIDLDLRKLLAGTLPFPVDFV